jgi:phospholipid/cholesterol/gamma-HCH transport system substrate-binding protein
MDRYSPRFLIRLGLFASAGFILFIIIIFMIGRRKNLFNPVVELYTTFHNVSGLEVGNNIRFSGINIGTVEDITILNDTVVKVGMTIRKEVLRFIRNDCRVSIGTEGIIGDRIINISHGSDSAGTAKNGAMLLSVEPIETDAIFSGLAITVSNLEVISDQLAQITIGINNGNGILGRLIQDSVFSRNISETVVNLKKSSKGLNENMEAAKNNILLRRYFNKKEKEKAEQARKDSIENAKEIKNKEKDNDK